MIIKKRDPKQMALAEVTKELAKLRLPLGLVFTPTNLEEEKDNFFASDSYNPVFKYKIVRNENKSILEKLARVEEISDVDPRISDFYIELIVQKSLTDRLMNSVGNNQLVSEISTQKYRKVSPILFRNACRVMRGKTESYKLLDEDKVKEQEYLEYDQIKVVFEKVLEVLGLADWNLEKSKKIARNGVKMGLKTKKIYVDPGIKKRPYELRKTIVHEVGTHLLRAVNGLNTGYEAFFKPNLPSYLDVEEGLAMYNEEMMGTMTAKDLVKRAIFVWAIYMGHDLSFRSLYNALLGLLPKKEAFDVCYRVKRGLGDTSKPGIYAKDVVYFRGFRKVRRKIFESRNLYASLYAGKINFKQVEWVVEGLLARPAMVPDREMFERAFKLAGI